jgi:hypothetical protein
MSCTAALAGQTWSDAAAEISILPLGAKAAPQYDCTLGNELNENMGGYASNHTGAESYAILFDPAACPGCELGVTPTWLYFVLRLNAGANFQLSMAVADAIDTGGGCYIPGAVQLVRPATNVPSNCCAGGWIISMPWTTGCMESGRPYFLIVSFPDAGTGVIGPYSDDNGATPCRTWRHDGTGWVDPASSGVAGDILFWAETTCCSAPVPTDGTNWGSMKSLFR